MLVSLAVVALAAVVALPQLSSGGGAVKLGADARVLAARLREAREMALATRTVTAVTLDLTAPGITGPGAESGYRLASVARLSLRTAHGLVTDGAGQITFDPAGGSSGGDIILQAGSLTRVVRVEWLTGAVSTDGVAR